MSRLRSFRSVALSLLLPISLSLPILGPQRTDLLEPRTEDNCFATSVGITDFRTFSGSTTQPASVSFRTGSKDFGGQILCSTNRGADSTSPYFMNLVACNKTGLPNFFFSYPEDRHLRVYQITNCGTSKSATDVPSPSPFLPSIMVKLSPFGLLTRRLSSHYYLSLADGDLPLFCYPIFGGEMCMTPTGHADLPVTEKEVIS
jgi:hypothetical protein